MAEGNFDQSNPARFAANELHSNPDAPLRHFLPENVGEGSAQRDRFNNRVFTSPTKSYLDREENETKAALLISQEGESFIKTNPGILKDIDRGLTALTSQTPLQKIDLGQGRQIEHLFDKQIGKQSTVLLLTIGDEKYVLKVKAPVDNTDLSQPYINEMLQAQAMAKDLQTELDEAEVKMPTFLFASGQISCTKFVEGNNPTPAEVNPNVKILPTLTNYIEQRKQASDPLWKGIALDLYTLFGVRVDNFIKQKDEILVAIDPFAYLTEIKRKNNLQEIRTTGDAH